MMQIHEWINVDQWMNECRSMSEWMQIHQWLNVELWMNECIYMNELIVAVLDTGEFCEQ